MSYTQAMGIWKDRKEEPFVIKEYQNSHGSGPAIWNCMGMRYLGCRHLDYHEQISEIWPLHTDLSIPRHHRAVFIMSFDKALVARENYNRMAFDLAHFVDDFQDGGELREGYVCHLRGYMVLFNSLYRDFLGGREVADCIGFAQSVSENHWRQYDDNDDFIEIDFSKTYEVYHLLDVLDITEKDTKDV